MKTRAIIVVALAALISVFSGCKSNSSPTNSNNTTFILNFVGTVNGDNGSMTASLVLLVTDTAVTGKLRITAPAVDSIPVTGTYNKTTKALSVTGGGYIFTGVFDGTSKLDGTVTGTRSGTFVAIKDDSNAAVAFCGSFSGNLSGVWNFTIEGTNIIGTFTTSSGTVGGLSGSISGNNITITKSGGGSLAVGTRSGNSSSGTWDDGSGNSGTWSGSKCN